MGLLKAQQEERINEINQVKEGPWPGRGWGGWGVLLDWGNPTQVLAFPLQQFLDDPKYSSDEDLPSKLEVFQE